MAGGSGTEQAAEGPEAAMARSVFQRLKELQCPSVEGLYLMEPETMQELLCTPSLHRLDILEWICTRICPALLDQFSVLKESQVDVKIKEMARLGFQLMMCRAEDLDLIKGLTTPKRQLTFMSDLLNVITSPELTTGVAPSGSVDQSARVREKEEFLKQMFSSPHFPSIRNPVCNPWPSDFKSLLLSEEPSQKRSLPAAKTKDVRLEESLKLLKETSETLEELKRECSFIHSDAPADSPSTVVQALKLAVSDFLMLMSTFSQVYESEFRAHCNRPTPLISDCGPLFQAVHQSLGICSQELQAIIQVSKTSECIVAAVQRRQEEKQSWGGSSMMTLSSKIEQLRRKYERFHVALHGGGEDLSQGGEDLSRGGKGLARTCVG